MNRKFHIAYFLSAVNEFVGGADQTLFMQAYLMSSVNEVTVILPCDINGKYNTIFQKKCNDMCLNYKIMKYDAAYSIRCINAVGYLDAAREIENFVTNQKIDILHSVQMNPAVEYVAGKCKIPHVMNIYSLDAWEWQIPYSKILPRYVSSDSVFFLEKWKEYLQCSGKCIRVYSGIKVNKNYLECHKETMVLGTSGTLCEYKNQLEVIKAVETVIKQGRRIRLLLAGSKESAYGDECREYIKSHHLQDSIKLLGFMEDMSSFYEQIDVLVCGSKRESFPASIVEAMSCDIPIISTPVAGVPEILNNGTNAYITEGYSADSLAKTIEKLLGDHNNGNLYSLLENARKTYDQFFSGEAVKKQLSDLYHDMLSQPALQSGEITFHAKLKRQIEPLIRRVKKTGITREDAEEVYSRMLYFMQIRDKITAKECYIWGAGKWGRLTKIILDSFMEEIHIRAFVDENKAGYFEGIDVIKKEAMVLQGDIAVFIGFMSGQEKAVEYLNNKNMEILKSVFIVA